MKEIFKIIPNFQDYEISNIGNIVSLKSNKRKKLTPADDGNGYLQITLYEGRQPKVIKVHSLVAITFLNHKPSGHKIVIDHIDMNKSNNRVDNLQLITNRENTTRSLSGGTSDFIGVYWNKSLGKWQSQIKINGKNIYLGVYSCEIAAAYAYKQKLNEHINNNN